MSDISWDVSSDILDSITSRPEHPKPKKPLTRRELQTLVAMAEGLSNKRIADRLGISDHTAKFHVCNACQKMGCTTRTEAVAKAIRAGIV